MTENYGCETARVRNERVTMVTRLNMATEMHHRDHNKTSKIDLIKR